MVAMGALGYRCIDHYGIWTRLDDKIRSHWGFDSEGNVMQKFIKWAVPRLRAQKGLVFTYCLVYLIWGLTMNWVGQQFEIARFTFWWQVVTCYIFYMVPISLVLRGLPFHQQYAYGLIAMALLEFTGYALETSYAYPNNILDLMFNERNFSLGMALFFALYFPLGNALVNFIYNSFVKRPRSVRR